MKRKLRWMLLCLLSCCMALTTSGCIIKSIDELYAVPKQSSSYYDIDTAIAGLMVGDMQYSAPISGANRQPVQLADLDGDGASEALVFLKSSAEKPLHVYLLKKIDGKYQSIAHAEYDGTSFESVEYIQLDDRPGLEMVLGVQVSEQVLHAICVYSVQEGALLERLRSSYTEYTTADLDKDGISELCLIRQDNDGGVVELFDMDNEGNLVMQQSAPLSKGTGRIRRIITGNVTQDVQAVFVASMVGEDEILTDVFAICNGTFQNISLVGDTDVSSQTIRNYTVYAADVDADTMIELPRPRKLQKLNESSEENFWLLTWYNLTVNGRVTEKMTTYHNFSGGWYLEIPEKIGKQLIIARSQTSRVMNTYTFYFQQGRNTEPEALFSIYAITGENRNALAMSDGRFIIGEKGEVTYAASFSDSERVQDMTQEDLISRFHYIHVDWNSGEM